MFKVGQKVVCVEFNKSILKGFNFPQKGEILTIKSFMNIYGYEHACINGYEFDLHGRRQCFALIHLRPLDETFAESVLENIKEQIKEEQLILV